MSELSGWRECFKRAEDRLRALDDAARPPLPAEEEEALAAVVCSIRRIMPKAMRWFLEAKRPPPKKRTDLKNLDLTYLKLVTVQWLAKEDLSELGSRVDATFDNALDYGHANDRELKRARVGEWLSVGQEFLNAINVKPT